MSHEKSMEPSDLPQKEVFKQKEVYQHPQPAGGANPLKSEEQQKDLSLYGKEALKTSKSEGLNEERSEGNAGEFEGFEDQNKK